MRKLTYEGFLKQYLHDLSGTSTISVKKLIDMLPDNPRLYEPLVLYVVLTDATTFKVCNNQQFINDCNFIKKNLGDLNKLPDGYKKVYKSYQYASSRKKREDDTKMKMLKQIQQLQVEKSVTVYRICKDLQMDRGNVNEFIRNKNCDRLSIERVERIWRYLQKL